MKLGNNTVHLVREQTLLTKNHMPFYLFFSVSLSNPIGNISGRSHSFSSTLNYNNPIILGIKKTRVVIFLLKLTLEPHETGHVVFGLLSLLPMRSLFLYPAPTILYHQDTGFRKKR